MNARPDTSNIHIRAAERRDLRAILALIADDDRGLHPDRPDAPLAPYEASFAEIEADSRNELFVAELEGSVVGTFQLSYLPHIFDGGGERAQIEGMFVAGAARRNGVGRAMVDFALARARARGCSMAQLYSNKARTGAHAFYAASGFVQTHEGFKAEL